jgi:metal-responsive CopG/Arc/MetJ family transcriptional regulator
MVKWTIISLELEQDLLKRFDKAADSIRPETTRSAVLREMMVLLVRSYERTEGEVNIDKAILKRK